MMITTGVWGEVSVLAASVSLLLATLTRGRTRLQTPLVLWMTGASVSVVHAIRGGETDVLWQVSTNAPGFVALAVVVTLQVLDESAGSSSDRWVAAKVVGAVVSDLSALSEREVLAIARDWFDHYHRWGF
ncbi:MAG: hypothetical protein ACKOD2_07020 [Ilumatobacteraceae bacterium]